MGTHRLAGDPDPVGPGCSDGLWGAFAEWQDGQWQGQGAAADPSPAWVPVPTSPPSTPGRRLLTAGGAKNVACNSLTK